MKFEFDKKKFLIKKDGTILDKSDINGCFPIFIFYLKENIFSNSYDVLHFDRNISSEVRPLSKESAVSSIQTYNVDYEIEHSIGIESFNKVTNIITGYYDILKNEWFEIENISNDITRKSVFDAMVEAKMIGSKYSYENKDLYLHNLKLKAEKEHFKFLHHKDLEDNLNMSDLTSFLIDIFEVNKKNYINNKSLKFAAPLLSVKNYLKDHNIPEKDSSGELNLMNLFRLMAAYDVFELGLYQKSKNTIFKQDEMDKIDREDLENGVGDFFEIALFNERFIHHFF